MALGVYVHFEMYNQHIPVNQLKTHRTHKSKCKVLLTNGVRLYEPKGLTTTLSQ